MRYSEISELTEYYENDAELFSTLITQYKERYACLSQRALQHLSLIRALEVTNGIVQWSYRMGNEYALSVEQTRECMKVVIGYLNEKSVQGYPLDESIHQLMNEVRELYIEGFKRNNDQSMMHFYAHSTAQFEVVGKKMMKDSIKMVRNNFTYLFTTQFIDGMERYVLRYYDD